MRPVIDTATMQELYDQLDDRMAKARKFKELYMRHPYLVLSERLNQPKTLDDMQDFLLRTAGMIVRRQTLKVRLEEQVADGRLAVLEQAVTVNGRRQMQQLYVPALRAVA